MSSRKKIVRFTTNDGRLIEFTTKPKPPKPVKEGRQVMAKPKKVSFMLADGTRITIIVTTKATKKSS